MYVILNSLYLASIVTLQLCTNNAKFTCYIAVKLLLISYIVKVIMNCFFFKLLVQILKMAIFLEATPWPLEYLFLHFKIRQVVLFILLFLTSKMIFSV